MKFSGVPLIQNVISLSLTVIPLRILEKGTKPKDMTELIEPQVETAGSHTIMLKTDGTVWCYGIGKFGELGNGKETTKCCRSFRC